MLSSSFFFLAGEFGVLAWGSSQYSRSESVLSFVWLHHKCSFLLSAPSHPPSPIHTHIVIERKNITHTSSILSLFFGGGLWAVGCTHLQPYYPASSAAARLALAGSLGCWSFLPVASAPSTRSPPVQIIRNFTNGKPARNSEKARRIHVIVMELYAAA